MYDVFFLSYEEPVAAVNFNRLKRLAPMARQVTGIKGIHNAHFACAQKSRTSHFYVVDADNEVLDFDFDYRVPEYDSHYTHLWFARNPVNGLEYGWGGIKLFPKNFVLAMNFNSVDMTTSFPLKIIPEVKSITHFNTSPYDAWRSAFRECAKLSRKNDTETRARLRTWLSVGWGPFSDYVLEGAYEGSLFYHGNECSRSLNDFDFLKSYFEDRYGSDTRS